MNINTVDLNLFLVFRAIYMTRSVTQAGDIVHMTQSAVSNALKRLRERFDDPLFVRTPEGMMPTPMADNLIGLVEQGLLKFSQAIDQVQRFDPAQSDRLFRIALNDIGQLVLMPGLMLAARQLAPAVRFETIATSNGDEARLLLLEGKADVGLGSWQPMGIGFRTQQLSDETFVGLISRDHPIRAAHLTLEEYVQAEHVAYRPSGASDAALQTTLFAQGIHAQRKVVLTVAHALGLGAVIAASSLVLSVPSRLAQGMVAANPGLRMVYLPFRVGPVPILQQWHERFDSDSANAWLREQITQVFASLPPLETGSLPQPEEKAPI
ncbi:MAG: LysR family transcriptional regulator [Pseudomonadota bacterium]